MYYPQEKLIGLVILILSTSSAAHTLHGAVNFQEEDHGQIPDLFSKRGNGCAR